MSNTSNASDSSFELLLDTICNTFGGVLFISMLVVVLLNMTSRQIAITPPTDAAQAELARCRKELAQTQDDVDTWRTRVGLQEKSEELVNDPQLRELVEELGTSQAERADLEDDTSDHLEEIGKSQTDINDIAKQLDRRAKAIARAKQALAAADEQLTQEVKKRTKELKAPTEQETTNREVVFLLRKGRLCAYHKKDSNGNLVVNKAECVEKKDPKGKSYIEPKPNAGLMIDPSGDIGGKIVKRLARFENSKYYLAIFVWPDSFEHFGVVRNVAVESGFQYRLVPFPEGEKIYTGAGAGKATVQ